MKMFSPFYYFALAIGAVGTLNVFGAPLRIPQLIVVVFRSLSGLISCFSILLLTFDRFVTRLDQKERRIHVYYVLANVIPTIYISQPFEGNALGTFHGLAQKK